MFAEKNMESFEKNFTHEQITAFENVKHVLGPMCLFLPIMDNEFNELAALEFDKKNPNKIGPKANSRLKFLLDEYKKILPMIEYAYDCSQPERLSEKTSKDEATV